MIRASIRLPLLVLCVLLSHCAPKPEPVSEADSTDNRVQFADTTFVVPDGGPARFTDGAGPFVAIDEAHANYHTAEGRYLSFAHLLRTDGYRIEPFTSSFTRAALDPVDILVIANALSKEKQYEWSLPTPPAFTDAEVAALESWVDAGGRLMLIADHMPFPGAAEKLAIAFGIVFHDGFAYTPTSWDNHESQLVFSKADGLLADLPVTRAEGGGDVPFIVTFTGQAFRMLPGVRYEPLITLPDTSFLLLPEKAYDFDQTAPRIPGAGLMQGALVYHGEGRIAVFGEAAMFSAQIQRRPAGPYPFGMNNPDAPYNARFLLNVMGWLAEGDVSSPRE